MVYRIGFQNTFELGIYGLIEKGENIDEKWGFRGVGVSINKRAIGESVHNGYMLLLCRVRGKRV